MSRKRQDLSHIDPITQGPAASSHVKHVKGLWDDLRKLNPKKSDAWIIIHWLKTKNGQAWLTQNETIPVGVKEIKAAEGCKVTHGDKVIGTVAPKTETVNIDPPKIDESAVREPVVHYDVSALDQVKLGLLRCQVEATKTQAKVIDSLIKTTNRELALGTIEEEAKRLVDFAHGIINRTREARKSA